MLVIYYIDRSDGAITFLPEHSPDILFFFSTDFVMVLIFPVTVGGVQ